MINFFKVSSCNQFIFATFKKQFFFESYSTKLVYLNVAKINWLQPLTLKNAVNWMNHFFSVVLSEVRLNKHQ